MATFGMISKLHLYPFVPCIFPCSLVRLKFADQELSETTTASITIIKQRDSLHIGVIQNLMWEKSYVMEDENSDFQSVFRAAFTGQWTGEPYDDAVIRFYNNTRFMFQSYEFALNIEKLELTASNCIIGTLSTASCERASPGLRSENLPGCLIVQFEIMSTDNDNTPLLFSHNPKLFLTGDALNHSPMSQHNPDLRQLIAYAPYDIHFYPTRCHIVNIDLSYSTDEQGEILIAGVPNEGFFETEITPWVKNTPLSITLRSFSAKFVLEQGSPIATLFYVHKMSTTSTIKNLPIIKSTQINNVNFIGNMQLPGENFLHYDSC